MTFMKRQIDLNWIISVLFFVVPFVVIICCFGSGISGNDFWWHIKVGEYIVETGVVPKSDIFSWYGMEVGIEWTAHEWLADVVYYLIFNYFGSVGIFMLSIGGAFALYICLWSAAKEYVGTNILISGVFFSLFGVLTKLFFYGRPHVFSYFFLFFELKILYEFIENVESKNIFLIPVIAALWSNLHGGSSNLVYILCFIFLFIGLFNFSFGRIEAKRLDKMSLFKLLGVAFASIAGIMINPLGVKVLAYPYVNLSDNLSMTIISEWQAPDAKLIGDLVLYFLPIVVMSIGLISETKKVRFIDLIVMIVFLFLFFRSVRFIILWYIAAVFYAFRYIPNMKVKAIVKKSEKITVYVLAVFLLVLMIMGVCDAVSTYKEGNLISKAVSNEAVEAIKKDSPKRLYNDYNIGETLIYNDIPVFFDARADLYAQENIMADGVSLMYLEQANKSAGATYVDVDGLIEKYEFDAVAILRVRPMYSYIVSHPERFVLVYEDDHIGYYRIIEGEGDE